jgi:hypothetical protein
MKLRAGPMVVWAALIGASSALPAHAQPLSLKLSRDIEAPAPAPAPLCPGTVLAPAPSV